MCCNSRQSIAFLGIFNKYIPLFGLMPFFCFKELKFFFVKEYRIYCLVLSSFIIFFWYGVANQIFSLFNSHLSPHFLLLMALQILGLFNYLLSVYSSTFWNNKNWLLLLKKICFLEKTWGLYDEFCWYKNDVVLQLIVYHVISVMGMILMYFSWTTEIHVFYGIYIYIFMIFEFYFAQFLNNFIIYNVSLNIKHKYKFLEMQLRTVCGLELKCPDKNFGKTIRGLAKTYRDLTEIVDHFYQIFGWQILLALITVAFLFLSCFEKMYIFVMDSETSDSRKFGVVSMVGNILFILIFLVSIEYKIQGP